MAYVSQGSSEDKLPRSLWGFTTWASKCSAWLSGNHLASFASEIHDSILTEALKQNAEGKCSEKRFEVFCSLVPKPGCFVPFHYCFSKRLAVNLGVTYKFGFPHSSGCLHPIANSEEVNLGTINSHPVHSKFQGVCGALCTFTCKHLCRKHFHCVTN